MAGWCFTAHCQNSAKGWERENLAAVGDGESYIMDKATTTTRRRRSDKVHGAAGGGALPLFIASLISEQRLGCHKRRPLPPCSCPLLLPRCCRGGRRRR